MPTVDREGLLREILKREPVELDAGVAPADLIRLALTRIDDGYRMAGEDGRADLLATQVDWTMQQWAAAEARVERMEAERDEARSQRAAPLTEEQLEARRNHAHEAIVRGLRRERDAALAEVARLSAEADALRGALEDTRAAADDLVPACLQEGDNRAAGALQFVSGFISDHLTALTAGQDKAGGKP